MFPCVYVSMALFFGRAIPDVTDSYCVVNESAGAEYITGLGITTSLDWSANIIDYCNQFLEKGQHP